MRFRVLGPLAVHDGTAARTPDGPMARVLLGVLLLHPNRPVPTDVLQHALWGECPPATAGASLKNHIARLRRTLAEERDADGRDAGGRDADGPRIRSVSGGYVLRVEPGELDADEFTAALAAARAAYLRQDWPAVGEAGERGLSLWRGTPLPEIADLPQARPLVERHVEGRWQLLEWRIDAELALGRHQGLAAELSGLITEQPMREAFHRQLMLALHRTGQQAEALAVYGRLRRTLADELGVEPGADVLAAHQEILRPATPPRRRVTAPAADVAPAPQAEPARRGTAAPSPRGDLEYAAESLARQVNSRWIREEEQRRIHDPFPLPVGWRPAPAHLLDHWDNIADAPPGTSAGPVPLEGGLAQVAEVYRRIRSGRLVVLGRAGSGKSVLTSRFVLDYLATRSAGDPVPVVFSIGAWDPTAVTLRDWIVDRLLRDHPDLAAGTTGRGTTAAALVDSGWILPVLDGFDEIARGLHGAALRELNESSLPLVLTSRTEQFAAAASTGVLGRAAGIELTDLTLDDLAHYLPRTARSAVWDPVLDRLRHDPQHPSSVNLAAVLSTPLMVLLARTLYSDTPGQDPAELLDVDRCPTPQAIEDHLLAGFVPTVYRHRPPTRPDATAARTRRAWDPDRARHYLAHLARHLDRPERRDRQDLAWWHLAGGLSMASRLLAITLACSAVAAGVQLLVFTIVLLTVHGMPPWRGRPVPFLLTSVGVGVAFALIHWTASALGREPFAPSRMQLRLTLFTRTTASPSGRRVLTAARAGLLAGSGMAVLIALYDPILHDPSQQALIGTTSLAHAMLVDWLLNALTLGIAGAVAFGLMAALQRPFDLESAATPAALLALNRTTAIRQALFVAPIVATAVAVIDHLLHGPLGVGESWAWAPLVMGLYTGLITSFCYVLACTAWGQWFLFVRVLLPLTGRLPWAPLAFLEDAYRRGVLRQAGAVYQFRHVRLQHHLNS